MKQSKSAVFLASAACVLLAVLVAVDAAINGCGDMFLRSSFAEIGISTSGFQNSRCAASPGFHPAPGYSALGFMYDRFKDGDWGTFVGDFSLPGDPEMRFGLTGSESRVSVINGMDYDVDIPTLSFPFETTPDRIGKWVGQVNFLGTTLRITKTWDGVIYQNTGFYITVEITNVGSSATSEGVYYFESHDPDGDVALNGDFDSTNQVTSNGGPNSEGTPYWQVTARGTASGGDTAIFYTSYDPRSFVSSDPEFGPLNAFYIVEGPKTTIVDDTSIGIAANLGTINPGQTVSYSFLLGFGGVPPGGAIEGDPHITGLLGQRFDFQGKIHQTFNFLTDSMIQVNAYLDRLQTGPHSFLADVVMKIAAFLTSDHTIIANAGGVFKDEKGFLTIDGVKVEEGSPVQVDDLSVSFQTVRLTAKELGMQGNDRIVGIAHIVLQGSYSFDVFFVENHFNPLKPEQESSGLYFRRFIDIKVSLLDPELRPHGIIGQTAHLRPEDKGRSLKDWKIEGTESQYRVDGLMGKDFAFNKFQA